MVESRTRVVHHVHVRILFFAHLREACGIGSAEIEADEVTAVQLWDILLSRWPRLANHRNGVRLARNGSYAAEGETFRNTDEVALIPPVSGG